MSVSIPRIAAQSFTNKNPAIALKFRGTLIPDLSGRHCARHHSTISTHRNLAPNQRTKFESARPRFLNSERSYDTMAEQSVSSFFSSLKQRRSYYAVEKKSPIPDSRIQEIVKEVMLHLPSSFNTQSVRSLLLLGEEHEKFWKINGQKVIDAMPEEKRSYFEGRVKGMIASYGTVCFFDDQKVAEDSSAKYGFPLELFAHWGIESCAMHQYAAWTALELEGLGANLQHYHAIADLDFESWKVPKTWNPRAQLVFGQPIGDGGVREKTFQDVEGERMLIFGK